MLEKRRKIWIDRFQTLLMVRVAFYFLFYQIAIWSLVAIERTIYVALEGILGREMAGYILLFLIIAVMLIGVLFIYEAMKFTHRLVGPLVRFRHVIKAITAGEEVPLVRLRQGDFLGELRDDFNDMLRALEERGAITLRPERTPGGQRETATA